jgi:hypothetical protein
MNTAGSWTLPVERIFQGNLLVGLNVTIAAALVQDVANDEQRV